MATITRNSSSGGTVEVVIDTARMDRIMAEIATGGRIMSAVQKAAFDIEKRAKGVVPVDTGNLANSIRAEQAKREGTAIVAEISANTDYAYFVEKGHMTHGGGSYVPGRHYMENSLMTEAQALERALRAWAKVAFG
jgi:hypothetical protein